MVHTRLLQSVPLSCLNLQNCEERLGAHARTHMHARTHARTHARRQARTHARTNERTHARTHARTHSPRAVGCIRVLCAHATRLDRLGRADGGTDGVRLGVRPDCGANGVAPALRDRTAPRRSSDEHPARQRSSPVPSVERLLMADRTSWLPAAQPQVRHF